MACLNRRRHRRRKKAKRAKWGFELELEELQSLRKEASGSSGSGGLTSSSEEGTDSVTMPPITRFILEGSKLETKISRMNHHGRATYMEDPDYAVNPDPVPFMPSNFMSSTMLKKIPIPKRHQDTFGGYEYNFTGQRGVMLHTDRYQFEALKSLEGLNQRERLLAEMAYLEHLRGIKRRREVVPHRAQLDLFLGGKKIECEERFDINREIQRLKAMAMPTRARDLFHGRGIMLPPNHLSIAPRQPRGPVDDSDSEEEVRISAPASLQRVPGLDLQSPTFERQISLTLGEVPHTRSFIRGKRFNQLPSINKTQAPKAGLQRDDTNASRSQNSLPQTSRSAAWVEEQNQLLVQPSRKRREEELFVTRQQAEQQPASATEKPQSPEAPPPTTEGGPRYVNGSRQTSPQKSHTPNPLKAGMDLDVSDEQVSNLRQTFQRLDTDMDGDLQYHQLKSQLPKEFSRQQEYFVKQVYEITRSSAAFFGVDEFLMMSQLTNRVATLTGPALEAFGKLDFDTLESAIIKYVALFQGGDISQRGRISLESLRELIGRSQNKAAVEENSTLWNNILDALCLDYASQVNRIEYLAHIPLFMAMAPLPQSQPQPQQEEHNDPHDNEL